MKRKIGQSISSKLTVAFSVMAVVQSIIMAVALIYGGVTKETQRNAYQIFDEKVESRRRSLENEMNHVWTNFDHYTEQIRQYVTEEALDGNADTGNEEQLLKDLAPVMLDALNNVKTTGVFLILDEPGGSDSHEALYLRNSDPARVGDQGLGLYLVAGPWSVAEELKIVTDINWNPRLVLNDTNRSFYEKPFACMGLSEDTRLLGYWAPPFSLFSGEDQVITYSIPLADKRGEPIGVFGVEISVDYLYKFLPYTDLQTKDAYGYTIGIKSGAEQDIRAEVSQGALQHRLFEKGEALALAPVEDGSCVMRLGDKREQNDIFFSCKKLGLYYNHTPFSEEEWYLMGIMDKQELLYLPRKIDHILLGALIVSLCAGVGVSAVLGRTFTRLSRLMELSDVPVGAFELTRRKKGVFMTGQVPQLLSLTRDQERLFRKDKEAFLNYLQEICRRVTDETNVFSMNRGGEEYWLRITWKEKEGITRGVIEDVTDEILDKKVLMQERDCDELTGVKNRKAFTRVLEQWNEALDDEYSAVGILMCDLNGLKQVNDALGHDRGDDYICYSANAICHSFPGYPVFRIGGDEFVVLLKEGTREQIEACEQCLKKQMKEFCLGEGFDTGIAVGYALFEEGVDLDLEHVLVRADARMYADKRKKNNMNS